MKTIVAATLIAVLGAFADDDIAAYNNYLATCTEEQLHEEMIHIVGAALKRE
jgi:hypothetical protein